MCLIITGPSDTIRSTLLKTNSRGLPDLLQDIYQYNGDGVGVMYKNKRGLRVVKVVPTSLLDVVNLIDRLPQDDRNLAIHFRMTTHGDTNLDNCHPYPVADGVAMMHNGILACGNAKDKTRSDTYHFIQEFLADTVAQAPKVVHSPGFLALVGDYIDNNRFVFMDKDGEMSIVNREQGIEHGGMWFSNEYAWDAEKLIPGYRKYGTARYYGNGWKGWESDEDAYSDWQASRNATVSQPTGGGTALTHYKANSPSPYVWSAKIENDFIDNVVVNCDTEAVAYTLNHTPYSAIDALFKRFDCTVAATAAPRMGEITDYEKRIIEHALDGDLTWLRTTCQQRPGKVADVLCYYLDWHEKSDDEPAAANESTQTTATGVLPDDDVFWYLNHEVETQPEADGTHSFFVYDHEGTCVGSDTGFLAAVGAKSAAMKFIEEVAEVG